MINGKTESGFEFQLDDDVLDDYELLEELCAIDNGEVNKIPHIAAIILGNEQLDALKDHIRGENGRVSARKMADAIEEILTKSKAGKN